MKHTQTVECDRCKGKGFLWETVVDDASAGQTSHACPSCLSAGHVEEPSVPLSNKEAFVYIAAMRYAIGRQTYAGSVVVEALTAVLPRMCYMDRKALERDIADALFRNGVDRPTIPQWEQVIDRIQALNAQGVP